MDRLVLSVLLTQLTSVYTTSVSHIFGLSVPKEIVLSLTTEQPLRRPMVHRLSSYKICPMNADTSKNWNKGVPYIKTLDSEEGCKRMCQQDDKCKAITHYTLFGVETCSLYVKADKEARPQSEEGLVAGIGNKVFTKEENCGKPIIWKIDPNTGKQYTQLINGRLNSHSDSKALCDSIGGILPEPKSPEENRFVAQMSSTRIWLGMNNQDGKSHWVWESDKSCVIWYNWESSRRDTSQRFPFQLKGLDVANCAMILKDAYTKKNFNYYTTTWDAFRCNATVSSVVCEKQRRWTSTHEPTGKQYTTLTDLRGSFNRTASKALCASIGGILPEPRSQEENDFVASLSDTWFWLGMNDVDKEGHWVWDSDNSCVHWNYWESWRQENFVAEPSGLNEKNCAIIMNDIWPISRYNPSAWATIRCQGSDIYVKEVVCEKEVCRTEECENTAGRISRNLNTSVNPCDNMFEFSCGGWVQKNPVPAYLSDLTSFTLLSESVYEVLKDLLEKPNTEDDLRSERMVKNYYKSCMDTAAINRVGDSELKRLLKEEFGGWPIITSSWSSQDFSHEDTMVKLASYGFQITLNSFYVSTDIYNSSKRTLAIQQTVLPLGPENYLAPRNDSKLTVYQNLIEGVAKLMGGAGVDVTVVRRDAKAIVDFEIELAKISVLPKDRRNILEMIEVQTLGELQANYSGVFDWRSYVTRVMATAGITDVTDEEKITNWSPSYYVKLVQLLKDTDKRTLSNFLMWRFVWNVFSQLGEKYSEMEAYKVYRSTIHAVEANKPRFRECIDKTRRMGGDVVARLYVKDNFKPEERPAVRDMIENLKAAFNNVLDEQEWMDEGTERAARIKIGKMSYNIGYPEYIKNDTYLDEQFANVDIREDKYFGNDIQITRKKIMKKIRKLRQPVDNNKWHRNPTYVNAGSNYLDNAIEVTAAILRPPFYSAFNPRYLNYGGIGYIIGHEITHGFDDRGRKFDAEGNVKNWWSDRSLTEFNNKKQCMIDQYNNFTMPKTNLTVNGVITQGENIGDNGGLKQSFWAYRKWVADRGREEAALPGLNYTPDQMFFISFSQTQCASIKPEKLLDFLRYQPHPPGRFRVIGATQNSQDFAKAFNCPMSSNMNPSKKCSVW